MRQQSGIGRFIMAVVMASLAFPVVSSESSTTRPAKIGFLAWDAASCRSDAFVAGLADLGLVEGKNIVIECHHANGRHEGLAAAAAECVRQEPQVIVAITHDYAEAARRVTRTIPIVMIVGGDPVGAGIVESLSRPGGNITGVGHFSPELNAKRLELLVAVSPRIKRVAALIYGADRQSDLGHFNIRDTERAARKLGLELKLFEVGGPDDLGRAFSAMVKARVDAVYVLPNRLFAVQTQRIADLAMFNRLPTMHFYSRFPLVGGLMAYGVDLNDVHRRAALYAYKILNGSNPATMPIEQSLKFEMVINRRTARDLGLRIPDNILQRADRVIE